ncbi:hypothetical protein ACFYN3_41390 [Streptomyces lavendulae]|uniref:hypothetical protein n=1 Tax=Streptomyces lavendulae TaxID=1914 RepID=UPI00368ABF92
MAAAITSYVTLLGTTGYAYWLACRAFRKKPGFASWHMFAGVRQATFDLRRESSDTYRFNPWDFLPHSELKLSRPELDLLLVYVARVHHLDDLHGTVSLQEGADRMTLRVVNSRVLD